MLGIIMFVVAAGCSVPCIVLFCSSMSQMGVTLKLVRKILAWALIIALGITGGLLILTREHDLMGSWMMQDNIPASGGLVSRISAWMLTKLSALTTEMTFTFGSTHMLIESGGSITDSHFYWTWDDYVHVPGYGDFNYVISGDTLSLVDDNGSITYFRRVK
ncbi:MAG: hypothetical protein E7327_02495 [Clostridiales bacterium]|nr:hypothetical protein [Clostridiales bacterium]